MLRSTLSFWLRGAIVTCGALASAPAAAEAQDVPAQDVPANDTPSEIDPIDLPPEHDPLAHAWDRPRDRGGFYLRLTSGLGVHSTRLGEAPWKGGSDAIYARGFGSGFGADLGYAVAPWVAVHLDATVGVLWNGDVEEEAGILGQSRPNARIVSYGFAPAATFFTPHDFYLKTGFGVGLATIKQGGNSDTTDPGFYMDLAAGKDIYVSDHFDIGLQFQVLYMLLGNEPDQDEARVRQFLFGVSGAFNSI
jgi:hypothetical protein